MNIAILILLILNFIVISLLVAGLFICILDRETGKNKRIHILESEIETTRKEMSTLRYKYDDLTKKSIHPTRYENGQKVIVDISTDEIKMIKQGTIVGIIIYECGVGYEVAISGGVNTYNKIVDEANVFPDVTQHNGD